MPCFFASCPDLCLLAFLAQSFIPVAMKGRVRPPRERYASGRLKPTSRSLATKSGTNRKIHVAGLSYGGSKSASRQASQKKGRRGLREVKQKSYPEICALSEAKCVALLKKHKVLGSKAHRKCYTCGAGMKRTKEPGTLRCSGSSADCSAGRPRDSAK